MVTKHEMLESTRGGEKLLKDHSVWTVLDGDAARAHAIERKEPEAGQADTIQKVSDGHRYTDEIECEVEGLKLGEHAKCTVEGREDGLDEGLVLLADTEVSLPADGEAAYGVMEVVPDKESLAAALCAVGEG